MQAERFGEKEIGILAEALSEKAGPITRGDQSVLTWYLEWTVGGLMRAGPPYITNPCT
jgi:hypothetical protein